MEELNYEFVIQNPTVMDMNEEMHRRLAQRLSETHINGGAGDTIFAKYPGKVFAVSKVGYTKFITDKRIPRGLRFNPGEGFTSYELTEEDAKTLEDRYLIGVKGALDAILQKVSDNKIPLKAVIALDTVSSIELRDRVENYGLTDGEWIQLGKIQVPIRYAKQQ